jgi:hypothetical protein
VTLPHAAESATITVTRRPSLLAGLIAVYYAVIDGIKVGRTPRGQSVSFSVSPGQHTVKLVGPTGKTHSNEVALALEPGDRRSLICEINKAAFPLGYQITHTRRAAQDAFHGRLPPAMLLYEQS